MSPKRLNMIMTMGLIGCIIGSGALVYVSNNWLKTKSESIQQLKLEIAGLQKQQEISIAAKSALENYQTTIDVTDAVLPSDKDQAGVINQLIQIGNEVGLTIGSISFPSSEELGNAGTATAPSQTIAHPTIPGVFIVPVTLSGITKPDNSGPTYSQMIELLKAIETNQRTMQISNLTITPKIGDEYDVSISMNLFIRP